MRRVQAESGHEQPAGTQGPRQRPKRSRKSAFGQQRDDVARSDAEVKPALYAVLLQIEGERSAKTQSGRELAATAAIATASMDSSTSTPTH